MDMNQEKPDDKVIEGEVVEYEETPSEVEDTEDGGAIVRMGNVEDEQAKRAHFDNIIDEVPLVELNKIVVELLDKVELDKKAREKRDKLYEEGLRRTGLGDDAPGGAQFTGANKVVHPMLVEACVDFSARVMKELFPSNGPVKSKTYGKLDKDKMSKAQRKADFMNWQCTQQIREFRSELEQLSTQLPLGGGQYLKWRWMENRRRPTCEFVPIDDVYLPFAATNFYTAERRTHVQYITKAEYQRRVKQGMYIDTELGYAPDPEYSASSKANDKIEGRSMPMYNEDGLRMIYEISTELDIGDGPKPYLISIDHWSRKAVSLYRNWDLEDENEEELIWMVEFPFVPWRGAYPIGLTHMIGGLTGAATGSLRALLDSAHIQNVPTLLKLKGGPNGQTLNVQPTEMTEISGGTVTDDIRKLIMPVPFAGPSPTLFQLLGFLIEAGKGVVQTSFEKLSDQNPNQPVGTTMALIEQGMVVFNSIHARLHNAMEMCFKILHRINSAYLTEEDIRKQAGEFDIDPSDFDGPMDVVPVSDPQIFSETQRFAQTQAIMQRSGAMPGMYDPRKVEEMFLRTLKVPADEVLMQDPMSEDMDPVSENVAAAMGRPVYVLPKQDHIGHLMVHMNFLKSPLFGQNPAIIKQYLYPMAMHLRDHVLNYYLSEAHDAVDKAQRDDLISSEDSQEQVKVIIQVQQFIEQQLGNFAQELAALDEAAQQYAPQPPQMPVDNTMQIAQMNLQDRQQDRQVKMQESQAKLQATVQMQDKKLSIEQLRAQQKAQQDDLQRQHEAQIEAFRQQAEDRRKAAELASREEMNQQDNQTAMNLAAAEIASGERVAVSTGTGINPNP